MAGQGNVSALMRGLASGDVDPEALEDALEEARKVPRQVSFDI
jgi:sugar/nucleoside kinase (ribokinase family)